MASRSVAFLILAHQHPELAARLVSSLRGPDRAFFIHVDAKSDLASFERALPPQSDVYYAATRSAINWGGFSSCEATIRLIEMAAAESRFHRYVLLTGVCYPCRPATELMSLMHSDREFMDAREIPPGDPQFYWRISRNHLIDHPLLNPKKPAEHGDLWESVRAYIHQYRLTLPELKPLRIPYFYGPANWALTSDAVARVLDFVRTPRNADLMTRFRYSFCSDEHLFQTIVGNSPRRKALAGSLHYVDWSEASRARGKVLSGGHLEAIRRSGRQFARKMDPAISADLMDALDRLRGAA